MPICGRPGGCKETLSIRCCVWSDAEICLTFVARHLSSAGLPPLPRRIRSILTRSYPYTRARSSESASRPSAFPVPSRSTSRRKKDSRRPSSLAHDAIDRPFDATRSTACRLYLFVEDECWVSFQPAPLGFRASSRCTSIQRRFHSLQMRDRLHAWRRDLTFS